MKLKELQKILAKKKTTAILIHRENKQEPNIFYLTQTKIENGCLVITPEKHTLHLQSFEYEKLKHLHFVQKTKNIWKELRKTNGKIGINEKTFSIYEQQKLKKKTTGISKILQKLREQKTEEEIRKTRKACKITDKIYYELLKKLKNFRTEKETALWIEQKIKENNCENAFPPIVATGKNAEKPHHEPTTELNKGFCVIDFGVKYEGYCSDITRTVFIGKPTEKERKEYEKVLTVQQEAIKTVKPETSMKQIYSSARKTLGKEFIHGIGHGIGTEIHEPAKKLKTGMIITIEPGIYGKGRGIRIEDDVLVTKKGCEILTKATKELVIL